MDFREEYKRSAEMLSPDEQTVKRMKEAVLQKAAQPQKTFPFKRIAYIGGSIAACIVIGIVGITALNRQSDSSIVDRASNTNSVACLGEDDTHIMESATEPQQTSQAATSGADDLVTDADLAADTYDDANISKEISESLFSGESSTTIVDNSTVFTTTPLADGGFVCEDQPLCEPELEPEAAPEPDNFDIEPEYSPAPDMPDIEPPLPVPEPVPEPVPPSTEPDLAPEPHTPQIIFYNLMENCTIDGANYSRTTEVDLEADYSIIETATTPEGDSCEIYHSYTTDAIQVYLLGEFIGYYIETEPSLPVTISFSDDMTICNIEGREYRRFSTEMVDADFSDEPSEPHYDTDGTYYEVYYFGYIVVFCDGEQIGQYERI